MTVSRQRGHEQPTIPPDRGAAEPARDRQTVTPTGESVEPLPDGVSHEITTHVDERGAVCELFDLRWGWRDEPVVFAYCFTVRPGMIKGWGVHREHEDRYAILFGDIEVVLYDERPESSTRGRVFKLVMSEHRRRLLNIPAGIWHADRNIGQKDAVMINFPTRPYEHENPDKYRLPLDTDRIPHRFEDPRGG
jgi:dTDP-4-dehydrorhamnose 3,5-epimerase